MARRLDITNVKVFEVIFTDFGMLIRWDSPNLGFGEYRIYNNASNQLSADSEAMDGGEDKTFLEHLMKQFISQITIRS